MPAIYQAVADLERVHGGSTEPLLESQLFHYHGDFLENTGKMVKLTPSANLNPCQTRNVSAVHGCHPPVGYLTIKLQNSTWYKCLESNRITYICTYTHSYRRMYIRTYVFVCVEVLWPSQPNGVMSSAVSLPNHTFTGQA